MVFHEYWVFTYSAVKVLDFVLFRPNVKIHPSFVEAIRTIMPKKEIFFENNDCPSSYPCRDTQVERMHGAKFDLPRMKVLQLCQRT